MKKLVTTLALILAGASGVMAQGFLGANNNNTTPITARNQTTGVSNVVGSAGALVPQGALYVSLWVATNGAPTSALQQVALGTNSTATVSFAWGTFNLGNPLTLSAPWDGSFAIELLYRSWSISLGNTWNPAWEGAPPASGYAGQSQLLTGFNLGQGAGTTPATFGAGLLQGLVVQTGVPEPTTIALAGLGLISLLALRRRK